MVWEGRRRKASPYPDQELTARMMALAAVSTERERTDLMRALDALQARLDAHVAAQPKWRRQ